MSEKVIEKVKKQRKELLKEIDINNIKPMTRDEWYSHPELRGMDKG